MEKQSNLKLIKKWTRCDMQCCKSWVPLTSETVRALPFIDGYSKLESFDFIAECPKCHKKVLLNDNIVPDELKSYAIELVRKQYARNGKKFPVTNDIYESFDFTVMKNDWTGFQDDANLLERKNVMMKEKMDKLAEYLKEYDNGGKEKISELNIKKMNVGIPFDYNKEVEQGNFVMQKGKVLTQEQENKLKSFKSINLTMSNLKCNVFEYMYNGKNKQFHELFIDHPEYGFRLYIDEEVFNKNLVQYFYKKTQEKNMQDESYLKTRNWCDDVPFQPDESKVLIYFDADTMDEKDTKNRYAKAVRELSSKSTVHVSTLNLEVMVSGKEESKQYYFCVTYGDIRYFIDKKYIPEDVQQYAIKRFIIKCNDISKIMGRPRTFDSSELSI